MLNSYQDYYYNSLMARGWSGTHLLCLLMAYLVIALPFYLSFSVRDFWLNTNTRLITTSYNHTGYYALQVNYQDTTTNFITHEYSNIPGNAMSYPSGFGAAVTAISLKDGGSVSIVLTGYTNVQILSVNVILYYQVQFAELGKTELCGWMLTVPGNVVAAKFSGTLGQISSKPISVILSSDVVNLPPYYPNLVGGFTFSSLSSQLILDSLLLRYQSSSSIVTDSVSSVLGASRSIAVGYVTRSREVVNYYPSILQTLKFSYSTYLAFAIIFYYIFTTLFRNYVREGLLNCQEVTERIRRE